MDAQTVTVPSSPAAYYRSRRDGGDDHAEAVRQVCHTFGRRAREVEPIVASVRAEWEAPTPGVEVPVIAEPDPGDPAADEIAERIGRLQDRRQRLALDAFTDTNARGELADVEATLADAEADGERLVLARIEAARREREQAEQAGSDARATAQARADAARRRPAGSGGEG